MKPRSKKSNISQVQDFASETTEEVIELPSDFNIDSEGCDLPRYHVGMLGDIYIDFRVPLNVRMIFLKVF